MQVGKLPENVLKRSIFKQLHTKRPEVLIGAGVGEDCAALALGPDEAVVLSTDPITGTATDIGRLAIPVTINDIATTGAEPVGVLVTMLLPENMEEADIRAIARQMDEQCEKYNVQVLGGHTEITRAVNQVVLSVTGVGKVKKDAMLKTGGAKPGDAILVTKWIALEGTSIIAKEKEAELLTRLPRRLIEEAQGFDRYLCVLEEAQIAAACGAHAMHDVTEGGIFGALWEMAEASGIGLRIDAKSIPVRQESIEICEFFGINPYELISSGSMLIAAPNGEETARALQAAGIPAAVAGYACEGSDRLLLNGEKCRYLEPPKTDEIYKVV